MQLQEVCTAVLVNVPHVFHAQDILSFKMKSFTQQQCNRCDALFNATVTALTCNWIYFKGSLHRRKMYDWTVESV